MIQCIHRALATIYSVERDMAIVDCYIPSQHVGSVRAAERNQSQMETVVFPSERRPFFLRSWNRIVEPLFRSGHFPMMETLGILYFSSLFKNGRRPRRHNSKSQRIQAAAAAFFVLL